MAGGLSRVALADTGRPEAAAGQQQWQISTTGGTQPHWNADGTELVLDRAGRLTHGGVDPRAR